MEAKQSASHHNHNQNQNQNQGSFQERLVQEESEIIGNVKSKGKEDCVVGVIIANHVHANSHKS
jgi:hypothetical protein